MGPKHSTHPLHPTYHVEVGESRPSGPEHRASLDTLDPQVVGEQQSKDGDTLVVIGTSHRAGDVAGYYGDEAGCQQCRPGVPHLFSQEIGRNGR